VVFTWNESCVPSTASVWTYCVVIAERSSSRIVVSSDPITLPRIVDVVPTLPFVVNWEIWASAFPPVSPFVRMNTIRALRPESAIVSMTTSYSRTGEAGWAKTGGAKASREPSLLRLAHFNLETVRSELLQIGDVARVRRARTLYDLALALWDGDSQVALGSRRGRRPLH
jgi:hypothetical protein